MTATNQDFVDVVSALRSAGAEFIIVGAHALAAHGIPRATGDLDVLVLAEPDNAEKVVAALRAFGAPLEAHGIDAADFSAPGAVYQLGLPPRRIDILTELSGVTFREATEGAVEGKLGTERVRFIGRAAMIRNKRATGRPKDLADAALLEAIAESDG